MGYRFRLHRRDLPGRPDIVLPKLKIALFVHGCFWHSHPRCSKAREPKSRREYWQGKLAGNVDRDVRVRKALQDLGWRVEIIWQCETKAETHLRQRLVQLLEPFDS